MVVIMGPPSPPPQHTHPYLSFAQARYQPGVDECRQAAVHVEIRVACRGGEGVLAMSG